MSTTAPAAGGAGGGAGAGAGAHPTQHEAPALPPPTRGPVAAATSTETAKKTKQQTKKPASSSKRIGVYVRLKPLGVGSGEDGRHSSALAGNTSHRLLGYDADSLEVAGARVSAKKHTAAGNTLYSFPRRVFAPEVDQAEVYDEMMPDMVDDVFKGINCNVLAYGQTGSGKTHTMFGPPGGSSDSSKFGLLPRTALAMLERIEEAKARGDAVAYVLTATAAELYMGECRDMLNDMNKLPAMDGGIQGVREVELRSAKDVQRLAKTAEDLRATGSTNMNDTSSRSYAVIGLRVSQLRHADESVVSAALSFFDLAGSERVAKSKATGSNYWEARGIIYSLMCLTRCVYVLSGVKGVNGKRVKGGGSIPQRRKAISYCFRNCMLTRILEGSLVGEDRTSVVVTLSQAPQHSSETCYSLDFGEVMAKMYAGCVVRRPASLRKQLAELPGELRGVAAKLAHLQAHGQTKKNHYVSCRMAQVAKLTTRLERLQLLARRSGLGAEEGDGEARAAEPKGRRKG